MTGAHFYFSLSCVVLHIEEVEEGLMGTLLTTTYMFSHVVIPATLQGPYFNIPTLPSV